MSTLTIERKVAELHRRLREALPEILEAIQDEKPLTTVLLSNGLNSKTLRDLYHLGYLINVSGRTGRGARYKWNGPTTPEVLSERLPLELTALHRERWTPKGRGRYVRATVTRTCHRCQRYIERGQLYLVTATRQGERLVCLPCRRPLDEPAHEETLEQLRLQLHHLEHLQPSELPTWRSRLRKAALLLERHLNVHRTGSARQLYVQLETVADWLQGAEQIAERHLRALRYRAPQNNFLPHELTSRRTDQLERQRPTYPLPPQDQRQEIIKTEEYERGVPYSPAVVSEACASAVRWLRELGAYLDERHRHLQPETTNTPTA